MHYFLNMRLCVVLFLLVTHSATYAATVLSQGARNVKNGAPYGGASAIGDGVHDDTQAFLDALNIGLDINANPVAPIYVPPGNYLVSKQLILWAPGFIFGEPSSPPTIILKSGSITNTSSPEPFVLTLCSQGHSPYDTNWNTPHEGVHASTNNSFCFDIRDINFTVQSGNPGVSAVFLWQLAQRVSARNMVLTRQDSVNNCWQQDNNGGGGIIQNVTCNGGAVSALIQDTAEMMYRGCTFNGPVQWNGYWIINFLACTFNNPGGTGFTSGGGTWFGMDDCIFTNGTPFNPGGNYHLENTTFSTGHVVQFTQNNVYFNGASISGNSSALSTTGVVKGSPYANPAFPEPSGACVNVKSFGAKGDGSTDDTTAIQKAYAANDQVYFPPGTYRTSSTITLTAGQAMYGSGSGSGGFCSISGSSNPVIDATGNGSGNGVIMANIDVQNTASSGSCVTWNADPATSQILDCAFGQPNAGPGDTPLIVFQSGGGLWEESDGGLGGSINIDQCGTCNQSVTCAEFQSSGPTYVYAVDPEHFSGPTLVISNAQNVYCKNVQFEFPTNQSASQICQITGSNNINIDGTIGGGSSFPALFNISNSEVNLWGIGIAGATNGIVQEGSHYYGSAGGGLTSLDGYVDGPSVVAASSQGGPPPPPPPTGPNFVQGNYAVPTTTQTTVIVPYTGAQTVGDLNVVIVGWADTAALVSSVTDSRGNVYQRAVGPTLLGGANGGPLSQSIYYAPNIPPASAGANAVTVTFTQPATFADIRILEYSGVAQTNPVDAFASAVGNSPTSSSGVLTTTSATDLLIGANIVESSTNGAGTGFTQRLLTPNGDIAEDDVVTSTGTYTASTLLSASGGWVMQLVAFRALSGGG